MQLLGSMQKLRCQLWNHLVESFLWIRIDGIFQYISSELNVDQCDSSDENCTQGLQIFGDLQFFEGH